MRGKAASWYDVIDPRVILALPAADVSTAVVLADRRAIKNVFQAFGRVKNERDGREVIFPAASVGKMWFNSGVDIRGIASEFANLFRVAVRAWSEPNAKIPLDDKRRKLEAIHQYVAKFSNRAGSYYIRFTVKENTGGNIPRAEVHASVVSSISIYKTEGAELSTPIKTQAEDSAPFVDDKIALFLSRVNVPSDVAVIILIKDEKLHIQRCLERLRDLNPRQIFVVDSPSTDGSDKIAAEMGATVVAHPWPGTQAKQFNWALENLPIEAEWILRLDADEYLTPDAIKKLKQFLSTPTPNGYTSGDEIAGLTLELKRKFAGGEIRHATNGIRQVRIFRRGRARYAETLMDERLIVDGKIEDFDGAFYDDNLNGLEWWKEKHRGYAKREAKQAIEGTFQDPRKAKYYKLPRYVRAVAYFCIRYFLKGGFLDGKAGWKWNFWQGLWYRWIVDREIGRLVNGGW